MRDSGVGRSGTGAIWWDEACFGVSPSEEVLDSGDSVGLFSASSSEDDFEDFDFLLAFGAGSGFGAAIWLRNSIMGFFLSSPS